RDFKAGSKIRSEERYPATQRQQSIVAYVDSTGAVSAEYEYDPFGKVTSHTGMDFDFQFSTKFYDPDIGMYYYGYRHYSPELRRWISPDPIGEAGGLNLYGFCGNDGVNYFDEAGLFKVYPVKYLMPISGKIELEPINHRGGCAK
ncbi:MAG: RHS repeat-associated core domain-containing protein, partial [Kiritimatiellae bacterium]|nr:RHS repeat-associated core domain-containing protein [Kiritimatiellia bacterium]